MMFTQKELLYLSQKTVLLDEIQETKECEKSRELPPALDAKKAEIMLDALELSNQHWRYESLLNPCLLSPLPWTEKLCEWTKAALPEKQIPNGMFYMGDFILRPFVRPLWQAVVFACEKKLGPQEEHFCQGALMNTAKTFQERVINMVQQSFMQFLDEHYLSQSGEILAIFIQNNEDLFYTVDFWHDFLLAYPMLARQLTQMIVNYTEHLCEMCEAIAQNKAKFKDFFGWHEAETYKVESISEGSSDSHNGGRCVHILYFCNEKKLVYKPRNAEIDLAWRDFLHGFCALSGLNIIKTPKIFSLQNMHFCEYIEHLPLETPQQAGDFFKKEGVLCALVYLLNGSDFHAENIIAHGDTPILIDVETVIHSLAARLEQADTNNKTSVLGGNFLPCLDVGKGIYPIICGASADLPHLQNLPHYEGKRYTGYDFSNEIQEGFSFALQAFEARREAFLRLVLSSFSNITVRVLLRSTAVYVKLLQMLDTNKTDNFGYENALLWICGQYTAITHDSPAYKNAEKAVRKERFDLIVHDVPYYHVYMDEARMRAYAQNICTQRDFKTARRTMQYLLSPVQVDDGIFETPAVLCKQNPSKIDMQKLVDSYARLFEKEPCRQDQTLLWNRNDLLFYIGSASDLMLESRAGLALALGTAFHLYGMQSAKQAVCQYLEDLENRFRLQPGVLPAMEAGLAEGIGGLLLVLSTLGSCGFDVHTMQERVVEACVEHCKKSSLLNTARCSFLYSKCGVLWALAKTKGQNDAVAQTLLEQQAGLKDEISYETKRQAGIRRGLRFGVEGALIALCETQAYNKNNRTFLADATVMLQKKEDATKSQESILCDVLLYEALRTHGIEMAPPAWEDIHIKNNDNMLFGNAGTLYSLAKAQGYLSHSQKQIKENLQSNMFERLRHENSFAPVIPKPFSRFGFFGGDAGSLYSLLYSLHCEELEGIL